MSNDLSRWGTVKEAADIMGLHAMTIRRYINAGDLPARRKGIKLLEVDLDAVRRMLQPIEPPAARQQAASGARSGE